MEAADRKPTWQPGDTEKLTSSQIVKRLKNQLGIGPDESKGYLRELGQVYGRLRDTFTDPEAAQEWLHLPSPYLAGETPREAIIAGRVDRVNAALEALDSGVFI